MKLEEPIGTFEKWSFRLAGFLLGVLLGILTARYVFGAL